MGVSSLAAYNGSGTQGLAVTNTITAPDDGEVQSVFWNANDTTRVLLFGSSINEIPSTGGLGATWGGNQVFTVNNDLDALGDLYLTVNMALSLNFDSNSGPTQSGPGNEETFGTLILRQNGLINFIKRVEFMVGTQVWQTVELADILAANITELSEGEYHSLQLNAMGNNRADGASLFTPNYLGGPVYADGKNVSATFKLPVLTKTLSALFEKFSDQTEDGYLMAAAPHQQVKLKVYFANNGNEIFQGRGVGDSFINWSNTVSEKKYGDWSVSLSGKHQIICNAERQQLKNMPQGLPKRIKMTQNASLNVDKFISQQTVVVDLDHFSLYASYLVVQLSFAPDTPGWEGAPLVADLERDDFASSTVSQGQFFGLSKGSHIGLQSCELLLNSTSISGVLATEFLKGCAAESLGLGFNKHNMLSDDPTDRHSMNNQPDVALGANANLNPPWLGWPTPAVFFEGSSVPFKINDTGNTYIFPLASHAYDGSAIPLNRFDNIRLKVTPTKFSAYTGVDSFDTEVPNVNINVTCFGETTALYRGQAASLAMY